MEITKENFNEKLEEIINSIKKADFISIDTEFTSLLTDDKLKRSYFDNGSDLYRKERQNFKDVTICQLGLSTVKSCIDTNGYETMTYNFYIMPKSVLSVDPNICCQSSSVEFLMQANFDFRKWLLNGIPCLIEEDEQIVRKDFKEMLSDDYNDHIPRYVLDQLVIVEAWRNNKEENSNELSVFLRLPSYILHFMAAIYRRYNNINLKLDADEIKLSLVDEDNSKKSLLQTIESSFESVITENIGFVKVFNELKKDKVIVCHNGMIDLTLMFKQFHKRLPENYEEFKSELHELFADVYDTKRIARMIGLRYKKHEKHKNIGNLLTNSSLESVKMELDNFKDVLHRPKITHSSLTPKYGGNKCFYHEAGYDAFCTAYCFINLAHISKMLETTEVADHRPLSVLEHIGAVKNFRNEIPIQNGGISHTVLGGENPPVKTMNWIVVKQRKLFNTLPISDLNKLMAPFGRFEAVRLNDRSFLVATFRKRSIMEAFKCNQYINVVQYSAMKHSARLRQLTWCAAMASCGISMLLIFNGIKLTKT